MKTKKSFLYGLLAFAATHFSFINYVDDAYKVGKTAFGVLTGIGATTHLKSQNVGLYNDYATHKYIWFKTNSPMNYPDPCEVIMQMNGDTIWFHQNYFFFDTIVKHETSVSGSSSMLSLNLDGELAITSFSDILVPYSQVTGGPSAGTTINGTGFVKATGTVVTYDNSAYYLSSNPSGYITSVPAQSFSSLTGKPTTLSGYGITDAYPLSGNPSSFVNQAGARTSISAGTGIAYNSSTGVISNSDPNVIQAISLSTNTLFLSNGGGSVVLPSSSTAITGSNNITVTGSSSSYTLSAVPTTATGYGTGTPYTLTTTSSKIDFATTDPMVTLTSPGTYLIIANLKIEYVGLTTIGNAACGFKLRRTNNTAADLANATTGFNVPALTLLSATGGDADIQPIIYTTSNSNDIIEMWGNRGSNVTLGSIQVGEASLVAIKLY